MEVACQDSTVQRTLRVEHRLDGLAERLAILTQCSLEHGFSSLFIPASDHRTFP
jgi:hypothetical protein